MSDIIQLLPEHVANQIAAGEVIQRPASAVKELLENAVDSGAKNIQLIIKEGGRILIQIIDNGSGMSELDARLSFSRHATSKLKHADDLWSIRTMGFRGEALASVAAIAQVELKTRLRGNELGTHLEIEGTELKTCEPTSCPEGTSISVKNLFFNVPARRNFLKSNQVETKHILDEFQRVALAFPEISFSLINNEQEVYRLAPSSQKQRIISIFGSTWKERLVNLSEETTVATITGFIGKPEFARKSRGEQFFFINNRFIKNTYLHHAIASAYKDLIQGDAFPAYFIWFDVDPKTIDINIHPTKTEIKFEDERSIYAILRSAVKRSIGTYSLSPSLDFENESAFDILPLKAGSVVRAPEIKVNPDYNPFSNPRPTQASQDALRKMSQARWEDLAGTPASQDFQTIASSSKPVDLPEPSVPWQLHGKYVCTQVKSGMMIIDQQRAYERIFFERFLSDTNSSGHSQQVLFPIAKEFSAPDFELVKALDQEFRSLGFEFEAFGKNTLKITGVPSEIKDLDIKETLDQLLEQFKVSQQGLRLNRLENLAQTLAANAARMKSKTLSSDQMLALINQLFACNTPNFSPKGKPVISILGLNELVDRFEK
jgi:DNA mismatch repair protein MutL